MKLSSSEPSLRLLPSTSCGRRTSRPRSLAAIEAPGAPEKLQHGDRVVHFVATTDSKTSLSRSTARRRYES
jgi:hypothetical protein